MGITDRLMRRNPEQVADNKDDFMALTVAKGKKEVEAATHTLKCREGNENQLVLLMPNDVPDGRFMTVIPKFIRNRLVKVDERVEGMMMAQVWAVDDAYWSEE